MKKSHSFFCGLIVLGALVLLAACSYSPVDDIIAKQELVIGETSPVEQPAVSQLAISTSSTVTLNKFDLYLDIGTATTGTVQVQIRSGDGASILWSNAVTVASLGLTSGWKTFSVPELALARYSKYRIYITRSDAHNYTANNYITWRCSSGANGGADVYPAGSNSVAPGWLLDFSFRTYTDGGVDQQQLNTNYGFGISNTSYCWQEFIADKPLVTLSRVDLYLDMGSAVTGTATLQIRDSSGANVVTSTTVAVSSLPAGSSWKTFSLPKTKIYKGDVYRIYFTRSDAHNYTTGNYIFWRCSSGGVDAYPLGSNDVAPAWTLDFAFRTYNSLLFFSVTDQVQSSTNYGFWTSVGSYRWQEFVPNFGSLL